MIFSYPLFIRVCNEGTEKVFFPNYEPSYVRWIAESFIFVSSSYILAIAVPDITVVFGLTGATGGVLIIFVFPGIMYIKLEKNIFKRVLAGILVFFSTILGIVATVAVTLKAFKFF
jgi:hypothetical protein